MKRSPLFTILIACILALMLVLSAFSGRSVALASAELELTVDSAVLSDQPGNLVTFVITAKNTTADADTYTVTSGGALWPTAVSTASLSLAAGGLGSFNVSVTIPENAGTGDSDQVTVTVSSNTVPGVSTSLTLTTRAALPAATAVTSLKRPLIVIQGYGCNTGSVAPGSECDLQVALRNEGEGHAYNIVTTMSSSNFQMLDTGGVIAVEQIVANNSYEISQPIKAVRDVGGLEAGSVSVSVSYSDSAGNGYSEAFTLSVPLSALPYIAPKPTVTGTVVPRPQVVVSAYRASVDPLQPGTVFDLELDIRNMGNSDARGVTLVLGGGTAPDSSGTSVPGGVMGGSSDLTNFAPLGTSNLFFLGDLAAGVGIRGTQKLIVNVNTVPGAYPLKLSFVYTDAGGHRLQDDQNITLLVFALPQVETAFYRDPGEFFTGQSNILPLQVTNLGRKTYVLGTLKVTSENAEIYNDTTLVGALDPGGYFTLDSEVVPMLPGTLEILVTISYTDDFNQPRTLEQTLSVEVIEMPTPEPLPGEGEAGGDGMVPVTETFWQKVLRFFKGLLGLNSAPPDSTNILPDGVIEGGGGGGGEVLPAPVK